VEALDSAAALCGGKLPADAEQHRAAWLAAVR
jgi:hypothetical protein